MFANIKFEIAIDIPSSMAYNEDTKQKGRKTNFQL